MKISTIDHEKDHWAWGKYINDVCSVKKNANASN